MQRKVSTGHNYPDYDLENLKRPFFIFKKAQSDTLHIQKGDIHAVAILDYKCKESDHNPASF